MGLFSSLDQAPLGKNLYCVPFVFLAWIGFEHSKGSINICWMNQTQDSMSPGKPWISVQQPSGRIPCLSASHYVDSIHSWGSSHGSLICFTHFLSDYGSYPNPSPLGWSLDPMPDLCSPLLSRSDPESCSSSHHCLDPTWTDRSQAPWCGTVHWYSTAACSKGLFCFLLHVRLGSDRYTPISVPCSYGPYLNSRNTLANIAPPSTSTRYGITHSSSCYWLIPALLIPSSHANTPAQKDPIFPGLLCRRLSLNLFWSLSEGIFLALLVRE